MSQNGGSHARTPVGAQGDRRQQPNVTKTKGGVKHEVKIVEKRSCEKAKTDEEEWNQRMQIWEKKKERLSGSEWDKSFREAARSRLKGKKPWITPVTPLKKTPQRRIDRTPNSPGYSDGMNSHKDEHWEQKSGMSAKWRQGEKQGKPLLEAVGLKRESSRMELDNNSHVQFHVVQSGRSSQGALEEFKKKLLDSNDSSMASEKVEDISLERTYSVVMTDPIFVKTVLSPIQSVSECSTQTLMDHRSASFSRNNDEQRCGNRWAEKSEQCSLSKHKMAGKNIEELEINMKKELVTQANSKDLPHTVHEASEKTVGQLTESNKSKSEREEIKQSDADQQIPDNDAKTESITTEMVEQIEEIIEKSRAQLSVETKDANTSKMTDAKETKKNVELEMKPSCPSKTDISVNSASKENKLNEEPSKELPSELKNEDVALNRSNGKQIVNNEKLHVVQRNDLEHTNLLGHDVRSVTQWTEYEDETDENWTANLNSESNVSVTSTVQESNISHSITEDDEGVGWKFIKTTDSKERALHAIFSSPDTIFGNWKKPKAQPVFIASVTFEDSSFDDGVSDDDTRMILVESVPNEMYELRAKSRPLSDESIMVYDRSLDELADTSSDWYEEFNHPVMSSEEYSQAERMKSEHFREIIIDRSGCKCSYDGPCHTKILKNLDNYHLWRYEVCHDASQCSLKNSRNSKRLRQ